MAGLSLVGSETVSLFSSYGFSSDVTSFQRNDAFCSYTVLSNHSSSPSSSGLLLLSDTTADIHFSSSFLVNGSQNVRFYVGIPIVYQQLVVGTLFLMDHIPRTDFSEEKQQLLAAFGQLISEGLTSDDLETNFIFTQSMIQTVIVNIIHDLRTCHSELTKKQEEFNKLVKFLSNSRKSSKSTRELASESSKHQKLQEVDFLQTSIQEQSFTLQESLKSASLLMNCTRNLSSSSTAPSLPPSSGDYLLVSEWIKRLKKTVTGLTKPQEAAIRWDLDDCDGGWKYPESSRFLEMLGNVLSLSFLLNLGKWKNINVSVSFILVTAASGLETATEAVKEGKEVSLTTKNAKISIEFTCFHRNTSSSSSVVYDDSMICLIEDLFVKIMELFSGDFTKASSLSSDTLKFSFLSSLQQIPSKPQRKSMFLRNSIVAIAGGLGITSLIGTGNETVSKGEKENNHESSTVNALANATLSFLGKNIHKSGPVSAAVAVRQDSSSNVPSSNATTAAVYLSKKEPSSIHHKLEHALTAASSHMGSNNSLPVDDSPRKEGTDTAENENVAIKVPVVKKHRRRSTLAMRGKIKHNIISSIIDSVAGSNGNNLRKSTIIPSN
jgi:hypothetical protein